MTSSEVSWFWFLRPPIPTQKAKMKTALPDGVFLSHTWGNLAFLEVVWHFNFSGFFGTFEQKMCLLQ
jgi:hypothetical protein